MCICYYETMYLRPLMFNKKAPERSKVTVTAKPQPKPALSSRTAVDRVLKPDVERKRASIAFML